MELISDALRLNISAHGAEPVSLQKDGREYLWCASPDYWSRHAPILFPIVGKLVSGRSSKSHEPMSQHGFARDMEFQIVEHSSQRALLQLSASDETKKKYPADFKLSAEYTLTSNKLIAEWTVRNCGFDTMYYQIGAHPAFNYPNFQPGSHLRGYMRFETSDGQPLSELFVTPLEADGFCAHERHPLSLPDNLLPLTEELLSHDALVLEMSNISRVVLLDESRNPYLSVTSPQAVVWGIWSKPKPGCPFVCIEPWCGRTDSSGYAGPFVKREYVHRLQPAAAEQFSYIIELF